MTRLLIAAGAFALAGCCTHPHAAPFKNPCDVVVCKERIDTRRFA